MKWKLEVGLLLQICLVGSAQALLCHQCTTKNITQEQNCMNKLLDPLPCDPSYGYCIVLSQYLVANNSVIPEFQYQFKQPDQQLTYIGRTCVQYFTGNECDHGRDTKTGQAIVVCRHHCSTDGCNASSNLSGNNLVMTMMIIVFGFISLFGINV